MDLADKIRKIEALIAGANSEGERHAAEFTRHRLQDKIAAQPIEYTVRVNSPWKKKLFLAICNKHRLCAYRYMRQKYPTTMVQVSKAYMDSVLWPEFNKHASLLDKLTDEILTGLISKIHLVNEEDETIIASELPAIQEIVL